MQIQPEQHKEIFTLYELIVLWIKVNAQLAVVCGSKELFECEKCDGDGRDV